MPDMPDIHVAKVAEPEWVERELRLIQRAFDVVFDGAPLMMHAVDKDFRIVKVNRRWLQRMGYKRAEVLGRRPTDFLTEELRALAAKDVIPAIWHEGSSHSSGPHHQDSGEAKIRESTAGVSRKPSSDCKACGCSSKHLCGLTAWNT